jgi:putative copper resistance protein D
MELGLIHLVRWALYVDVGLIFGMPAVALAVGADVELKRWRGLLVSAGLICFPLSIFGFLVSVAQMADVRLTALDGSLLLTLLTGSALGLALMARSLAALVYSVLMMKGARYAATVTGGVAAATLAWSGHGGSSEGALGYIRLIGDILHLLAASAWIGALILFLLVLFEARPLDFEETARVRRLLSGFALAGSVIVGTLLVTGLSNMLFIAPPSAWPALSGLPYGCALLVKLALFVAMLALAAINRFMLVPRLAGQDPRSAKVVVVARVTVAIEALCGIGILALVAWLGSLDPHAI